MIVSKEVSVLMEQIMQEFPPKFGAAMVEVTNYRKKKGNKVDK